MKVKIQFLSKCKPEYRNELLKMFLNYGSVDGSTYNLIHKDKLIEDFFKWTGVTLVFLTAQSDMNVAEDNSLQLSVTTVNDRELTNIVFPLMLSGINFRLINDLILKIKNKPLRTYLFKSSYLIPMMQNQLRLPAKGVVYYIMKSSKITLPNLYSQALFIEGSEGKLEKTIDSYFNQLIKII